MSGKVANPSPTALTVGTLAQALGVNEQTVRRLDGALVPLRTPDGVRIYLPGAIEKARALLRRRRYYRRRAREIAEGR